MNKVRWARKARCTKSYQKGVSRLFQNGRRVNAWCGAGVNIYKRTPASALIPTHIHTQTYTSTNSHTYTRTYTRT